MRRYDAAPLSKVERTPQGGLKIQGVLTKTGIFQYRQPNGEVRKEYRPPEEVFSASHMDSFKGAPITIGHPGLVTPDNWRDHAVGHIGDEIHQDGDKACGTLYVQDAKAVERVGKDLHELSCGYDVDLDETPGELNGERYDAVQRNIRGNHVAMGPKGWGRAGRDVAMRLDSSGNEEFDAPTTSEIGYTESVTTPVVAEEPQKIKAKKIDIHVDGQAEIDRLSAENEMLKAQVAEQSAQLADTKRVDSLVAERVELVAKAKDIVKDFKADGKSNREIKAECVLARNPKIKLDSVSDDFVEAAYQMALTFEAPSHPTLGQVRADAITATEKKDELGDAIKRNAEASRNAWKGSK